MRFLAALIHIVVVVNQFSIFIAILIIVSLIATFYREAWIFDSNNQTISFVAGVGPITKKTVFHPDDIEDLIFSKIYKVQKLQQGHFTLQAGGKQATIETARKHNITVLEKNAEIASKLVGIELTRVTM